MSNPESFIDEVTEEVRRDKLYATMRRYGWIGIVAVLVLVGGAAYIEWSNARARAAAQALGDEVLAAMSAEEASARARALEAISVEGDVAAVIRLLAAGEADGGAGRDQLQAVADNTALPRLYRDLATLKLVLLPGAEAPEARIAALEPLTSPGAPFRLLAEEQIALALLEKGDGAGALDRLQQIWLDGDSSGALRRRAGELILALGGTPEGA